MKSRTLKGPLWVRGPSGHRLHRKREYTKAGGKTLCGIHVGRGWWMVHLSALRRCKRCAA